MTAQGERRSIDLDDLVDNQRVGRGAIPLIVVAFLVLASDGFDLSAMGYLAPELVKQWGLTPAAFVPAFSAGIIGMMVGGPLLGVLGDRFGRKRLILAGLVIIGLVTLATMAVRSTTDLVVLRFITGIGLGGVIPNVVALIGEIMPRRVRGRFLVLVTLGVPLGIALPGFVAATLVPAFGWRAILLIGGLLPLAVALAGLLILPESIKYLMAREGREAEVRRIAQRLRPDLVIDEATRITLATAETAPRAGSFRGLFAADLAAVTPLLWFCQAANQMANFFALTWLPTLLQSAGASTAHAGASASLFSLGGLLSGLALLLLLDRLGVILVVGLFIVGAPLVATMAMGDLSPTAHNLVILGAGVCVTGVQIGITALLGIFYPTTIRSTGTGWTQAAGRVGALAAPIVGGVLLGLNIPIDQLPLAPAAVMALGALASVVLAWLCIRRAGGLSPVEFTGR